ncbi:MAG: adenylate/guanylate cyclase domain-containing protein [Anaerolineae bacterium]|jgi:class 3 adenylate cyclase|nr:adenylate/guanylate cyclase domain-containing protein [Anaerolineae bacterium]
MGEALERVQRSLMTKQKEFDIILMLDRVRDTASGPMALLSGVVKVVADQVRADFCLLYLLNAETGTLELKVVNERGAEVSHFSRLIPQEALRRALLSSHAAAWEPPQLFPAEMLIEVPESLCLVTLPIIMEAKGQGLGIMVLGRDSMPFTEEEMHLLEVAESQIDSSVVQSYMYHELSLRNKELETIYKFDRIRDQNLPFDEMLTVVLQELCTVIRAQMGFVMLYDRQGRQLELRAVTPDDLMVEPTYAQVVTYAANKAVERAEMVCYEEEETHCSVMCVPLILNGEILGVFGALNRSGQSGFTGDERQLLHAIVSQMDTAILESLERRRLRRLLGRSLDPYVLERLLADPNVDILKGERSLLTVLYADLRGSTRLSERLQPETLVEFINDYLGKMTEVLLYREGTLDKYVGDEVMALFGAPLPQPDHALRAVRVGLEMQAAYQSLAEAWRQRGVETDGLGIGIATGELIVGEMGCDRRTDYTVIGVAANLGSRICAAAQPGQVLISQATYELVRDQVEVIPWPGMQFKGLDRPVTVYQVIRVSGVV